MTTRALNSFKIKSGNKLLDYRLGEKLALNPIKKFFQRDYRVEKLWYGSRHILGVLVKDGVTYFLKLSTSEGMSIVTKNEYLWNNYFNKYTLKNSSFIVPRNRSYGLYQDKYLYLITEYFEGGLLCGIDGDANCLTDYISRIISFAQIIQEIPVIDFSEDKYSEDFKKRFIAKVNAWFDDTPADLRTELNMGALLEIVTEGTNGLLSRPRHGDFTPWHMIKLSNDRLGLIDGEHALSQGVENYDICYFIQRTFSVLKKPAIAEKIYSELLKKGCKTNKLKTVMAARAIGGFLDESLKENPDYEFAGKFKDWVINN